MIKKDCPICHEKPDQSNINEDTGIATCIHCSFHYEFKVVDHLNGKSSLQKWIYIFFKYYTGENSIKDEVEITDSEEIFIIKHKWATVVLPLVFNIVMTIIFFLLFISSYDEQGSITLLFFSALAFLSFSTQTYFFIISYFNKTTIKLNQKHLQIYCHPFPLFFSIKR